ncbi:MAG: AraC family transcriptional regulator [Methylocella sp.]
MGWDRGRSGGREFIDLASSPPLRGLEVNALLSVGAVTLTHWTTGPVEGRQLGEAQIGVAIHDGAAFDMDWRGGESDRLRSSTVSHGRVHVRDGRLPFWVRCNASTSTFAFAVEESFVTEIWRKGFDGTGDCFIGTSIGGEDPVIGRLAALGRIELNEGGAGGRLYLEGLASALAVHLLRTSGLSRRLLIQQKGGLAPRQIRRVLEYIEAHLTDELGLSELAAIVELSPHYFGEVFRISTGKSPHRYVMERRIERARGLLWDADRPIHDIAYAAGFSSQSHFTANFRRVTGVTPGRFRRSLP